VRCAGRCGGSAAVVVDCGAGLLVLLCPAGAVRVLAADRRRRIVREVVPVEAARPRGA
jgi:hypothetical protein